MEKIFAPGEILVPQGVDMEKWSVVACDQYTSQPEYWDAVEREVGDAPSALRLILPEARLGHTDQEMAAKGAWAAMEAYLQAGILKPLTDSFILVRRKLRSGAVRLGLMGLIDLEQYDYHLGSSAPIRATEGTVEERLPPRVAVRAGASLELPHVVLFLDDPERSVVEPLYEKREELEKLYDFSLMQRSGAVAGWRVMGQAARETEAALAALFARQSRELPAGAAPLCCTVGDGNHSLAAAKACWKQRKAALTPAEAAVCPARWSLVELVNIHDGGVAFAPIHRLVAGGGGDFLSWFRSRLEAGAGAGYSLTLAAGEARREIAVSASSMGALIARVEALCQEYIGTFGGSLDYIHGEAEALALARRPGGGAVLLPTLEKGELFSSVSRTGPFPRKSFSVGHAEDKRFYLEVHRIR